MHRADLIARYLDNASPILDDIYHIVLHPCHYMDVIDNILFQDWDLRCKGCWVVET